MSKMANFTRSEFEELWHMMEAYIMRNYNVGLCKKFAISGKDALFYAFNGFKTWRAVGYIGKNIQAERK